MSRRPLRPSGKLLAEDARRHHRALLLQHLFSAGPASRADLARATGLTRVTVSDLVAELLAEGLVGELGSPVETKVGKPPTLVGIVPDAALIGVLDLSPADDRFLGALLDLTGAVVARVDLARDGLMGGDAAKKVVELAHALAERATSPLLGLGIGAPGVVDPAGVVLDAPNLGWTGVDVPGLLRGELDVPVYVANDVNAAVLGEHTYGDAGEGDLMLVRIGVGVGAGMVLGGALLQGVSSAAGEIGHVTVDPHGRVCACGRTGCLETVLAVPRLREGDLVAAGRTLGETLAPVVATLNLAEVVLAGPPDLLDGALRDSLEATLRERVMPVSSRDLVVRTTTLGDDVVLRGASVLVLSGELGVS